MTELKPGWRRVKFGDVVRLSKARSANPEADGIERYVGLDHIDPEDLRIRRWGLVAEGTTFTTRFKPGQVLFGKRRAYQRKVAVADFEGVCSGDIYVFESADPSILLPELLPFICQTDHFFEYAVGTSAGSLSPRTNWNSLANFEFSLPPLQKQKYFVDLLSSSDNALETFRIASGSAAKLHDAYTVQQFKELTLNAPNTFLKDVADVQYGLTVNAKRRQIPHQIPYLRVANVQRGNIDLSEIKLIGKLLGDDTFLLSEGDVLIVEGHADQNEVGRAAVWMNEVEEIMHQNHLIRARCKPELLPQYLCAFINSPFGKTYFRTHAKSTSGLNTLNSTVVKQLKIPLPAIEEQQRFVKYLAELYKNSHLINERSKQLKAVRKKILGSTVFSEVN